MHFSSFVKRKTSLLADVLFKWLHDILAEINSINSFCITNLLLFAKTTLTLITLTLIASK